MKDSFCITWSQIYEINNKIDVLSPSDIKYINKYFFGTIDNQDGENVNTGLSALEENQFKIIIKQFQL